MYTQEYLRQSVLQSLKRPARKYISAVRLSKGTTRRILHKKLHFHPYRMMVLQQINPRNWILDVSGIMWEHSAMCLRRFIGSDETHFHLRCVNKQNFHYWSDNNSCILLKRPFWSSDYVLCSLQKLQYMLILLLKGQCNCYCNFLLLLCLASKLCNASTTRLSAWMSSSCGATAHTAGILVVLLRVSG